MANDDYRHFVCIVAGDKPEELMAKYDKNLKTEKRVLYRFEDIGKIRQKYIDFYDVLLKETKDDESRQLYQYRLDDIKEMSDDDFYDDLAEGLEIDPDNGNIVTDRNEDGKWSSYNIGKNFSVPMITKDGVETFQCRKKDVDWNKVHLNGSEVYERVWEMVMEGSEPRNDDEKVVYDNMSDKVAYFKKFGTKENYVTSNTAFWGYAFLSDMTGWMDPTNVEDQFVWMSNFYDCFIKPLPDNTLITIMECIK